MSTSFGNRLPQRIVNYLNVENESRDNTVIFFLTSDEEGLPHVALLSPFQVVVTGETEMFVSVHIGTKSQQNVQRDLKGTLILQADPAVNYIKFKAEFIEEWESKRNEVLYRIEPLEVLQDYSEKVPYLSQLKFDSTEIIEDYFAGFVEIRDYIKSH